MLDNKKFYFILVFSIISLSIISFIISFISIKVITKNNIEEFKKTIISQKKSELLDRISIVYKIIESNYNTTLFEQRFKKVTTQEPIKMKILFQVLNAYYKKYKNSPTLKEDIKLIVQNATFDNKKFYFWINDLEPRMIMHPILSELNSKSLQNFKDINGEYPFNQMVDLVKKQKEGFISYYWYNPATNKIEKKVSYVKLFEPLNWIIGTGIYFADNINKVKQKTINEIRSATFGKNGYFWINDIVQNKIYPSDLNIKEFIIDKINELKNSKYIFIIDDKKTKQIIIMKLFKPWNWVIGTSLNLLDVETTIKKMQKEADLEIKKILIVLLIANIIVIFIILIISRKVLNRYQELATKDKLTSIYNRLKIDEVLKKEFEIAKRYNTNLSIIFFDIDHFKKVNDTYGHKVGDYVLQEIAKLVSKNIRKTDIFGRWGGEEFIIILPQVSLDEAYKVAQKLRKIIAQHNFKVVGHITCSFGVASFNNENNVNELIEKVDKLLYKSKRNGRNRVSK